MTLTGLTLAQLAAVFGGAAAVTTLLYLLKLRRRRVAVPFIGLWQQVVAERQATRLYTSLKRLISFLIALCVVALLTLALGDPRSDGASPDTHHTVVLVDTGVSMQATDVKPNRLEVARAEVKRIARSRGGLDRMLIAEMNASTTPLTPMTDDSAVLDDGIEALATTDLPVNLATGLDFAHDVLEGKPNGTIIIVSDGAFDASVPPRVAERGPNVNVSFLPIGQRDRNTGISAFAVRRYPLDRSRSELFLELHNHATKKERVELTLLGDGRPIEVDTVEVPASGRIKRVYDDISGVDRKLEARIQLAGAQHDDLAVDDGAYALLPGRRRARVLCVTAGNRYLEAALLLDEYLEVQQVDPADYSNADGHDVVIFDGVLPPEAPNRPALYLNPIPTEGRSSPVSASGIIEQPYFDRLDKDHPVLRWTALGDVNAARALRLVAKQQDRVLAADERAPLIVAGERNGQRFVALGFDIRETDLPLRIAWPLLLLNTIDWFVQEDGAETSSIATGELVDLSEGGHFSSDRVGFHQVEGAPADGWVAVNLHPASDRSIAPAASLAIGGRSMTTPEIEARAFRDPPWVLMLLAVVAVLFVEWATYHRRWTL